MAGLKVLAVQVLVMCMAAQLATCRPLHAVMAEYGMKKPRANSDIVFKVQNLGAYSIQLFVAYHNSSGERVETTTGLTPEGGKLRFKVPHQSSALRFDLKMIETGESIMMMAYRNTAEMKSQCTSFQVFGNTVQSQWQYKCI